MKELIKKLSGMRGISGYEYRINEEIKKLFEPYADEVAIDAMGNVTAIKRCGKENPKKILFEAHIDEIGLMVKGIDKRGFITVAEVGGIDPRILPSAEVIIHGKRDIKGIVGAKPPHLQTGADKDEIKLSDMAVDTGMSYDEANDVIAVGDSITFGNGTCELLGEMLSGKSLDDRSSVAALITVFKNLERIKMDADVYAVCSVKEEVGGYGAMTAAYRIEPDIAIAVDVCHGITPDNSYSAYELGCGAVVTYGPNIHPKIYERIIETAKKYNIKTKTDVDGGNTGTDAWVMQVVGAGIPTGLLSIPLRYMHTSVETLDLADVKAVADLLTFFVQDITPDMEEWLCL